MKIRPGPTPKAFQEPKPARPGQIWAEIFPGPGDEGLTPAARPISIGLDRETPFRWQTAAIPFASKSGDNGAQNGRGYVRAIGRTARRWDRPLRRRGTRGISRYAARQWRLVPSAPLARRA